MIYTDQEVVDLYSLSVNKNNSFMDGKKTYAFLLVAFLGWLGLGEYITESEVGNMIDIGINLIGIVGAIWGRAVAKP